MAEAPVNQPPSDVVWLGSYRVVAELARGGMAAVFLAVREAPGEPSEVVAIKQIHPHLAHDPEFVAMLMDEARIASQIRHPNVVEIKECNLGTVPGQSYLVMEYAGGEALSLLLKHMMGKGARLTYGLSASIGADVAGALHAAHELRGPDNALLEIVHRDVSPQNVILTYDGRVKLTDFGIAKALGRLQRTVPGEIKGKLAYMSPEQAFGREVDRRSDVYSLGIVLYELALGRRLFGGKSDAETVRNIMNHVIPAPRSLDPTFPAGLEEIILGMLTKDMAQRFQSAGAVERALRAFVATSGETDLEARRSEFVQALDPVRFQAKTELVHRELARLGMLPPSLRSGPRKAARHVQDDDDPPTVELRLPEAGRGPGPSGRPRPATQPPAPREPVGPSLRPPPEEPPKESPFERTILAHKPVAPVTPRPPPRPVSTPPVSYPGFQNNPFLPPQPPVQPPVQPVKNPRRTGLLVGALVAAVVLFSALAVVVWRYVLLR